MSWADAGPESAPWELPAAAGPGVGRGMAPGRRRGDPRWPARSIGQRSIGQWARLKHSVPGAGHLIYGDQPYHVLILSYRAETAPNEPGVADSRLPARSGHGSPRVGVPLRRARGASSAAAAAPAECVPAMRVTSVRPGDLGPGEAETWATLQRSSPLMLSPYLSLTFAQIVGRARPNARIAVVEDGGEIVAFLAYELTSMKLAEPIGYPMNDLQGIISADTEIDARSVIRKAGLRGWRFYHAPAQHRPLIRHHYSGTTVQCALIDLSDGYQPWMSGLSKSGTKRIAEKRRSLQRHVGPVSLLWNSSRPGDLGQLLEWKSGQHSWMRRMFADDPSALRIVEGMAAASSADCSGVVSVLLAGDQTVAIHLGLQGPRGLSSWFPSYDSELSRFSPGLMMWYPIAEEAANRGIMLIDFGYGQHDYKFRLANGSYPVAGGAVWASRIEELARGAYRRAHGIVRQVSNTGASHGDTQSDRLQRPVVPSH